MSEYLAGPQDNGAGGAGPESRSGRHTSHVSHVDDSRPVDGEREAGRVERVLDHGVGDPVAVHRDRGGDECPDAVARIARGDGLAAADAGGRTRADDRPGRTDTPADPRNRRIEVTLLRSFPK